jgi:hypothetical protein
VFGHSHFHLFVETMAAKIVDLSYSKVFCICNLEIRILRKFAFQSFYHFLFLFFIHAICFAAVKEELLSFKAK